MTTLRLLLACAAVVALGACDDEPPPGGDLPVRVYVQDAATGLPAAGVKIAVMDPYANLPLATPLASDSEGLCDFSPLRGITPTVLVFGGGQWRQFGEQGWLGWPYPEGKADGLVAPRTAPVAPPALVRVIARTPPRGAHISGTVTDASSGRALAGAFLGVSRFPTGYGDGTTPSDDVTLADGSFQVHEIPFLEGPGGRPVQAVPLLVVRDGYRPRLWAYEAYSGEDVTTVTGVEIALEPAGGEPVGTLRGRVLRRGEPVPYLTVGLGPADLPDKGAVGLPGRTAATDRDGVFVFAGLPVGTYVVHPGFPRGDTAWFHDQLANVPRTVTAGEVTDAGDYQVAWELEPQAPRSGDVVTRDLRDFSWTGYGSAGLVASVWVVTLDRGEPHYTVQARWSLAPGDTLLPGHHVWTVEALGPDDAPIGTFGGFAEFLVVE